jgi:hypothetical protein
MRHPLPADLSDMRMIIRPGIGVGLGLILWFCLPTPTPRARLNVAETVAMLFFVALLIRARSISAEELAPGPRSRFPLWLALLAVFTVPLGFYTSAFKIGFISDDYVHLWAARQPLATTIEDVLRNGQGDLHFRPLGIASIFLDNRLWGTWAPAYHLTNVFLHLTAVLGVFILCQTLGMPIEGAAGSALIFSLLPVNTETVAWIAARFDLLATSLTVWTVVLYAKFRNTGRWRFYCVGLATFLLAVLSKESAYVLPLFLLGFELLLREDRRFKPSSGFLLLGATAFAYRWVALRGIGGYLTDRGEPSVLQVGWKSFEGILLRGPALTLMGVNWLQPGGRGTVAAVVLLSSLLLALVLSFRTNAWRSRVIRFGLLWLLLASLPVHTLLLIGPGLTNSRVLYLGSVGLAIVLGASLTSNGGARVRLAWTSLLLLSFGLLLRHNLRAWQWTSDFSRNFLVELRRLEPSPPAQAQFIVFDKPDTIRGIFFFHVGLSEAVEMTYSRPDLGAHLHPSSRDFKDMEKRAPDEIAVEWINDPDHPVKLANNVNELLKLK